MRRDQYYRSSWAHLLSLVLDWTPHHLFYDGEDDVKLAGSMSNNSGWLCSLVIATVPLERVLMVYIHRAAARAMWPH